MNAPMQCFQDAAVYFAAAISYVPAKKAVHAPMYCFQSAAAYFATAVSYTCKMFMKWTPALLVCSLLNGLLLTVIFWLMGFDPGANVIKRFTSVIYKFS